MIWCIGLLTILGLLAFIAKFVFDQFVNTKVDLAKYGAGKGAWAVVTGASDGIGKGYAEELAKAGFNLIIISRTLSKLQDLASKLKEESKVQVSCVAIDLANCDVHSAMLQINEELQGKQISFLVNNVGLNTEYPVLFADMSEKDIDDQIFVNITFTTKLTKLVIPYLTKNPKSGMIFLSSILAYAPTSPFLSVYAATKAYDSAFSKALYFELKHLGVDVFATSPYFVVSLMSGFKRPSFLVKSANAVAKESFTRLGYETENTTSLSHYLIRKLFEIVPAQLIGPYMFKVMKETRERQMSKKKI